MFLDPQTQALIQLVVDNKVPAFSDLEPAAARQLYLDGRGFTQPDPEPVAEVRGLAAQTPEGPVPLRLYRPQGTMAEAVLPALVYYHGGGWVIGDLDSHDNLCRQLANESGCAVVAVDYRLAPEHRFPAAVDDAFGALRWIQAQAAELRLDPARLAVGGDSAGGTLAAVCALAHRDWRQTAGGAAAPALRWQLLVYPVADIAGSTESRQRFGEGYLLSNADSAYFASHYLNQPAGAIPDWRHSPLHAPSHADLPPALVLTAGHDPLRDDGLNYAQRLSLAGNRASYVCFERQVHGFLLMGRIIDEANTAVTLCAASLRRALG